ncbi:glycosyltransferase [Aureimonas psammosilenae]|uniref:glycosyltransferase n=1 Tax=Aureimonas psammosilenae TaxID=2495496 RepID=UPI001260AE74|nr:glycosyltransferase [Aureimonas psammosilenae]
MTASHGNPPLVAIVTPVYNGEAFLEKTMASVQNQTYPNIVHVVLDNASVDGSAAIIERFLHGRVKVEFHRNEAVLPLQENWNRAFSFVPEETRYVKLNCADDLMRPDAIERMVELAETNEEIEVVLSDDVFDDRVRQSWMPRTAKVHDGRTVVRRYLEGTVGWLPFHHFFVRMRPEFPREQFCGTVWAPDPFVVARSALRGKVGYIPEPLVYTRYHAESVTGKEVKLGSIRLHLVPVNLWREFGSRIYDAREQMVFQHRFQRRMARMCLIMWSRKQHQGVKLLRDELQKAGQSLSFSNFAVSAAGYPFYKIRKLLREPAPRRVMHETDFAADGRN